VARYVSAFASLIEPGTVVIGRDTRPSGPIFSVVANSVLQFMGFSVVDIGVAATPTVEIMVQELSASGGIIITASHNGPEWNALKFLGPGGEFFSAGVMEELIKIAEEGTGVFEKIGEFGVVKNEEAADAIHIKNILELPVIDREKVSDLKIKVVVDCVNGAGSRIIPSMLRSMNVDVVELFTDTESPFPHNPEPTPANLKELSGAVKENRADMGFACDPDADRLVVCMGDGTILSEELTVALATDFILSKRKGPVAVNVSTSSIMDYICSKHNVRLYRSKVGEAHVVELMKKVEAIIGGEGNGGVIYPELHYGRDAMVGIALILQFLADEGKALEEIIKDYPSFEIVKRKLEDDFTDEQIETAIRKNFDGEIDRTDGIKVIVESGWIHARRSNTEPVVRFIAEASTKEEAETMLDKVMEQLI